MSEFLPEPGPSASRARFNRWAWWWLHRMGWPGALALVCLLAALVLGLAVRPALERARADQLRSQVQRLEALARARPVNAAPERDLRDQWRDALPGWSQRGQLVRKFLAASKASRVEFERADYNSEVKDGGIVRMQASMPVSATYEQVRQMMASVLSELPNAAIDAVELESGQDAAAPLVGRLRLSFFFRGEG